MSVGWTKVVAGHVSSCLCVVRSVWDSAGISVCLLLEICARPTLCHTNYWRGEYTCAHVTWCNLEHMPLCRRFIFLWMCCNFARSANRCKSKGLGMSRVFFRRDSPKTDPCHVTSRHVTLCCVRLCYVMIRCVEVHVA